MRKDRMAQVAQLEQFDEELYHVFSLSLSLSLSLWEWLSNNLRLAVMATISILLPPPNKLLLATIVERILMKRSFLFGKLHTHRQRFTFRQICRVFNLFPQRSRRSWQGHVCASL